MSLPGTRLRELDFLRGVAIILVLFRHQLVFNHLQAMGWIGVDLFFVISGFLVSGLLFREYKRYGNIKPGLFLIRRGFKIYPIYYASYILYLIPIFLNNQVNLHNILYDLTFTQNYFVGWGYAYAASWSLAVEEHFYFAFAFLFWLATTTNLLGLGKTGDKSKQHRLLVIISLIMGICVLLRFVSNIQYPKEFVRNFTSTHLRIDSLLMGVLVSYLYYFKNEEFKVFYMRYYKILLPIALALLVWTPFADPVRSFWIKTVGFSMLYISFGIILTSFLFTEKINELLNRFFSKPLTTAISKIGFCSYSIYIIHTMVNFLFYKVSEEPSVLMFAGSFVVNIIVGMGMTHYGEQFFLNIRDRYYPSRVA